MKKTYTNYELLSNLRIWLHYRPKDVNSFCAQHCMINTTAQSKTIDAEQIMQMYFL